MGIHISLLESHDNIAKVVLHITFMRSIVFEQEINFSVGQTFNLNNVKIESANPESNRYDISFSSN